ncbi:hypothetical protein ACFL1G_02685 [Planctomycetota bacterium]
MAIKPYDQTKIYPTYSPDLPFVRFDAACFRPIIGHQKANMKSTFGGLKGSTHR